MKDMMRMLLMLLYSGIYGCPSETTSNLKMR